MYYTYIHLTPNGQVFYVGKGTGKRAYSMSDRTLKWKKIVNDNDGILIKIVNKFETEQESFEHEIELIKMYKDQGIDLVNQTSGGKGPLDYCQSEESRLKKKILMTGYKYKTITCPHCNTTGGETSMKRWHFDKCTGAKIYKARVTMNGKRIFLGNFATKEQAKSVENNYRSQSWHQQ